MDYKNNTQKKLSKDEVDWRFKEKLCFECESANHQASNCTEKKKCLEKKLKETNFTAVVTGQASNTMIQSMVITIITLSEQDSVKMKALVDSGVEDNFISQYIVKELGLVPHGYTRAQMLDSYEIAAYRNHIIKYWLTDSYGQHHSKEVLFVTIGFTGYDFVLG